MYTKCIKLGNNRKWEQGRNQRHFFFSLAEKAESVRAMGKEIFYGRMTLHFSIMIIMFENFVKYYHHL